MSKQLSTVVVIVNYNTSSQVINAIKSLSTEDFQAVIVVDNASPNDNLDELSSSFPSNYVVLVRNQVNVGFGEACNVGFRVAKERFNPELTMFLNPDTVIERGLLKELSQPFENEGIGATAPLITNMNDKDKIWYSGGSFSWLRGSALVKDFGCNVSKTPNARNISNVEFATGCCFIIRSRLFDQLNGFDPRYFMYEEDAELSLSILKKGFLIHYVPTAIVRHIGQGSQGGLGNTYSMYDPRNPKLTFFVYYTTRNRFLTVRKHGTFSQRFLFYLGFPIWILRRGLPWLCHLRADAFKAVFLAVKDALINHK